MSDGVMTHRLTTIALETPEEHSEETEFFNLFFSVTVEIFHSV